ncbi:MAG TPA: alpha/beta fold hydrolase [Kofleriaceae bacterium]|nr:alpha/beta fold hydrolase [Kofleriaceae bacterium]
MRASASAFDFPGDDRGILLLHGLTGTPYDMHFLAGALRARGFTVVAPTMAGHGGTAEDLAATGWRDWVRVAGAELDRLKRRCTKVAIAGQSMGGLCALHLVANGARVDAMATLGSPLWLEGISARAAAWLARGGALQQKIKTLPKIGGSDLGDAREKALSPSLPVMPARSVVEVASLMAIVNDELDRVRVPLLVLHGARDRTAPVASAARIATHARALRARLLPDSRHVISLDVERAIVADELIAFFERHLA